MRKTKGSLWWTLFRYGLVISIGLVLLAGTSYAHRAWVRIHEQEFSLRCRQARDAGNWVDLQRVSEVWSAWDRRNADAWVFRADAAQHQGDFRSAAECLEAVPETDPKSLPSLVALSTLQFNALNRPLDGVKTCERLLTLDARTSTAHQQLIEFYAMTLQRRQLEYQIRFAIRSSREPPRAYVYLLLIDTMRLENAVESNTKWLAEYPDNELFQVARVLQLPEPDSGIKNQQGDDKYSLADLLLEKFPQNLELLAYKVDLCIKRGNLEDLMGLLLQLPGEADEDPRFWRAKGWLHLTRGEVAKAKQALQQAIYLYPLDANARNWMADALRSEGNLAEAERIQEIVRQSRHLRQKITQGRSDENTSTEILTEIAEFARKTGDIQVADALNRRLGLK